MATEQLIYGVIATLNRRLVCFIEVHNLKLMSIGRNSRRGIRLLAKVYDYAAGQGTENLTIYSYY